MGETKIEWTSYKRPDGSMVPGYTFSPIIGCEKKSPGCKFCYAENETPARVARHNGTELWGPNSERYATGEAYWKQPVRWNLAAGSLGERRLVFCSSQSDWLEQRSEWMEPRAKLLKLISHTPNLIWLLLSKEPENFNHLVGHAAAYWQSEEPDFAARMLQGHPTKADLEAGIGKKRGLPVSIHNVWCDKECGRQAKEYVKNNPSRGLLAPTN